MRGQEHVAEMERLRGEGLSYPAIGERFGLSEVVVWRLLNPEAHKASARRSNRRRAAAKRAWARDPANRTPCATCGLPTAHTPGQGRVSSRDDTEVQCRACWHAAEFARTAERGHQIEKWWAQGLKQREIAERLGWSISHVGPEIDRLRKKGFDLPRRRPYYYGGGRRAA